MNWSKNLYVFMLGSLIVFSGCFGTGTTNGEDDDDVGTTVINNYYNNTTEVITQLPEMIAVGGLVFGNNNNLATHHYTHNISTNAGQMLEIVQADINGGVSYLYIDTVCQMGNGETLVFKTGNINNNVVVSGNYYLSGSAYGCIHTVDVYDGNGDPGTIAWSLVYSIHPVTVG